MTELAPSPAIRLGLPSAVLTWVALAIMGCKTAPREPEKVDARPAAPVAAAIPVVDGSELVSAQASTGGLGARLLAGVARSCQLDPATAGLHCPQHEDEHLAELFSQGKKLPLADAVAALHDALGSSDDKLRTTAAVVAEGAFGGGLGSQYPTPVHVTKAQFGELAQRFSALAPAQAVKVAPLLAHEGMLAGEESRTLQLLSVTPEVERAGYRRLLVYGRLGQLARVKSASDKDATLALDAAALMPAWSETEQHTLCSWAAPQYRDKRPEVRGAAGRALAQCDAGTLARLVVVAGQQGQVGDWAPGQPLAFAKACSTREQLQANAQLCENVQALLESGVTFAKLPPQTRVDSLEALVSSEQWMMDLDVGKLVGDATKSSDPLLASAARQAAAKLKSVAQTGVRQMLQLPNPAGSAD